MTNHPNTVHGHTSSSGYRSPEYQTWDAMMGRCRRPTAKSFSAYGARGVVVTERWRTFSNFLADMGPRPAGTTLDRIDNDGNYEPGNCRWATPAEQAANRSTTKPIEIDGRSQSIAAWARECGLSSSTIRERLKVGHTGRSLLRSSNRKTRNTLLAAIDGVCL